MTTAINNVSYAIQKGMEKFSADGVNLSVDYQLVAEQAIAALRHPTDDMMEVITALPQYHNRMDMWCAMIDVALGRIILADEVKDEERG